MFKKQSKKGSLSIMFIMSLPMILTLMFFLFDYLNLAASKVDLQRKLDSATLTVAILSQPDDDVLVDEDGYIVEEISEGVYQVSTEKACAISDANYEVGMEQLKKSFSNNIVIAEYDGSGNITNQSDLDKAQLAIYRISTPEQMENGVVRIQAVAKKDLMSSSFIGHLISWKYVQESYAVCNHTYIEIQGEDIQPVDGD